MTEQRYKAVQAVIADGRAVGQVASEWSVSRQTARAACPSVVGDQGDVAEGADTFNDVCDGVEVTDTVPGLIE